MKISKKNNSFNFDSNFYVVDVRITCKFDSNFEFFQSSIFLEILENWLSYTVQIGWPGPAS